MAGPHRPDQTVGTDGPTPESQPLDFPDGPTAAGGPAPANYAGRPVPYPQRRSKRRLVIGVLLAVALAAALTLAITYGVRTNGANTDGHNPPGNNGTVKIHDDANDPSHHNVPHVNCDFFVDFWGFDAGQRYAEYKAGKVSAGSI